MEENKNFDEEQDYGLEKSFEATPRVATNVGGKISKNTHWGINNSPYIITSQVEVASGVTLSIASGVTVQSRGAGITVNGTLNATRVTFTSDADANNQAFEKYWSGLSVGYNGTLNLDNVNIRYISTALSNSGTFSFVNSSISKSKSSCLIINVNNSTRVNDVTIRNSSIDAAGGVGLSFASVKNTSLTFHSNNIKGPISVIMPFSSFQPTRLIGGLMNNTLVGDVQLYGTLGVDMYLEKRKYIISDALIVKKGVNLTIASGSEFAMSSPQKSAITVNGTLNASGVTFTSSTDPIFGAVKPTYWKGFTVSTDGTLNISDSSIRYTNSTAISNSGTLSVVNSTIKDCTGRGIYIYNSTPNVVKDVTIRGNTITVPTNGIDFYYARDVNLTLLGNFITASISIYYNLTGYIPQSVTGGLAGNILNGDVYLSGTLRVNMDLPRSKYLLSSNFAVAEGITLNIATGSVMAETSSTNSAITVLGTLNATGVTFTSTTDPMYGASRIVYWSGLSVETKGILNLDRCEIRYTSGDSITNKGTLNLLNSAIAHSQKYGLNTYSTECNVTIQSNTFDDCKSAAIYLNSIGGGQFTFRNNIITNSTNESLYINFTNFIPTAIIGGLDENKYDKFIKMYGILKVNLYLSEREYRLNGDLTVSEGKKLTFAQGAKVIVTSNASIKIKVDGILNGLGSVSKPIIFTNSNDPEFGGKAISYWNGFIVGKTGSLNLDYAQIRYGNSKAIDVTGAMKLTNSKILNTNLDGIYINTVTENADIHIEGNEVKDCKGYGITLMGMRSKFVFKNNRIINSGKEPICIGFDNIITTSVEGGLANNTYTGSVRVYGVVQIDFDFPKNTYNVAGKLAVAYKSKLTIAPGCIINEVVSMGINLGIYVGGELEAVGTVTEPIIFTNYLDPMFGPSTSKFWWSGINVSADGKVNIAFADIKYTSTSAIDIVGEASIKNCTIRLNNGYGIKLNSYNRDVIIEDNNLMENRNSGIRIEKMENGYFTFQNNTIKQALPTDDALTMLLSDFKPLDIKGGLDKNEYIGHINLSGTLTRDLNLPKRNYHVSTIRVETGATLKIDAGSVFKVSNAIQVFGTLAAYGKEGELIVFTGARDPEYDDDATAPSTWNGISSHSVGNILCDYVTIRNAGKEAGAYSTYPIKCSGLLNMKNSTIENTESKGILLSTNKQPVLKNIAFQNVKGYYIYNDQFYSGHVPSFFIHAENLYWGSEDGPCVDNGEITDGGKISRGIYYVPFLTNGKAVSEKLHVQISYPTETIMEEVTAKISIQGGNAGEYYAELMTSWDNYNWTKRGSTTISLSGGYGSADIGMNIYDSSKLLITKAVLYDREGGNVIGEYEVINRIHVWYAFSKKRKEDIKNEEGEVIDVEVVKTGTYILSPDARDEEKSLTAFQKENKGPFWDNYSFKTDKWTANAVTQRKRINPALETPVEYNLKHVRAVNIKAEDLTRILDTSTFEYQSKGDVYVAKKDVWEKALLGTRLSDNLSQLPGMLIDWEPIQFQYGGKSYLVSIWKGQYYLLTGCEVQMYEANREEDMYLPMTNLDNMHIKLTLRVIYNLMYEIEQEADSCSLTAFKVGYHDKDSLNLDTAMTFPNAEMCAAFAEALRLKGYSVIVSDTMAKFTMFKTKYQNPPELREPDILWRSVQTTLYNTYKKWKVFEKNDPLEYAGIVSGRIAHLDDVSVAELTKERQLDLNIGLDKSSSWVYCNYPEVFSEAAFADAGYCLNRVNVNKGIGQVFYSYNGQNIGSEYKIGICVTTSSIFPSKFRVLNYGHADSGVENDWDIVPINGWRKYFNYDKGEPVEVTKEKPVWICEESIPPNKIFSGNLRFVTDNMVTVSVYAYRKKWNGEIGENKLYPYDYNRNQSYTEEELGRFKVYSGYGDGNTLKVNRHHIRVSQLLNNNIFYFVTNSREAKDYNQTVNPGGVFYFNDDNIPITIADQSHCIGLPKYIATNGGKSPLHNVANWSAPYCMAVTIENDTDLPNPKVVYELECANNSIPNNPNNVKDDVDTKYPIIQYMEENTNVVDTKTLSYRRRTFDAKVIEFKNGENRAEFDFQYILGTNSGGAMKHTFKLQ